VITPPFHTIEIVSPFVSPHTPGSIPPGMSIRYDRYSSRPCSSTGVLVDAAGQRTSCKKNREGQMNKVLKAAGVILAGIVGLILLVALGLVIYGETQFKKVQNRPVYEL